MTTPLTYNPQNFSPKTGIMQSYAKKVVNTKYYGQVKFGDINDNTNNNGNISSNKLFVADI